jgi:hypothetical protein
MTLKALSKKLIVLLIDWLSDLEDSDDIILKTLMEVFYQKGLFCKVLFW